MVSHAEHSRRSDLAALWADQIKIKEISQGQELTLKDKVHYLLLLMNLIPLLFLRQKDA